VRKHALATATPRHPRPPAASVTAAPAASALAPEGRQLSAGVALLLAFALGLLLLSVAVAVAPRAVLPGPVSEFLDRRRELVLSLVSAVILGVGAGLIVFALS
jgi:cytochrome c biogenesis protein CcdA